MTLSLAERRQRRPGRATADDHDIERLSWDDGFDHWSFYSLDRQVKRGAIVGLDEKPSQRMTLRKGDPIRIFALDRSSYKLSRLDLTQLSPEASEPLRIIKGFEPLRYYSILWN